MAARTISSLKTPILDDESTEDDYHEPEVKEKQKPVNEIVSDGNFKAAEIHSRGMDGINLTSISVLKTAAASHTTQSSKCISADSASLSSMNQTKGLGSGGITTTDNKKGSIFGEGWVSFEEDGMKKDPAVSVALVTNPQSGETPLVNGSIDKIHAGKTSSEASVRLAQRVETQPRITTNSMESTNMKRDMDGESIKRDLPNVNTSSGGEMAGSWVTFDQHNTQGKASPGDSSSVTSESVQTTPLPNWVTFDEAKSKGQERPPLEGLSINVSIANETNGPSTPSPNPFLNAPMTIPMKSPTNPFQGATQSPLSIATSTNPFHSNDSAMSITPVSMAGLNMASTTPDWSTTPVYHDVSLLEKSLNKSSEVAVPVYPQTPPSPGIDQIETGEATLVEEERPPVIVEEETEEDFSLSLKNNSWNMLLRYPDKKKRIGSREWKSVVIKLDGNTLQIFDEYELSAPFREIPLQASFNFQELRLQEDRHSKVHTTKLEYLKYKETRSVKHKGTIEHLAEGTPIIKIGSTSNAIMKEFIEAVGDSIRTLPAYRDRGITYRKDEVFVDVDDTCHALLDGTGNVKKLGGRVQVKIRAFVTGDPECQLVLNDIVVKEREEARLRGELKPQRIHHWINLQHCQFHKCVDVSAFNESHSIVFHPLDACTFELLRFRSNLKKPLPLYVKSSITLHSEQRIELRAEIQLCQETKMAKYARNNVVFQLPIPETWVPLFRTAKLFGREKSIKSSKGKQAAGIKSRLKHSRCSIAASLGTAKYEPEYSAIVWRIDKLPLIQSNIPVDAPQTLTCLLELPAGLEVPDDYQPHAEVEYDVSYVLLSDTTVIAVKVSNKNIPEKWVCYRALYHYHIEVDVCRGSSGPIRDVGCTQQ